MVNSKKARKAKQPLWQRTIKIIATALCCAILLAAIVKWMVHYYRHVAK